MNIIKQDINLSRKLFIIFDVMILTLITLTSILPIIHLLSVSISSNIAASAGEVKILPKGFTLKAYTFLIEKSDFTRALFISLKRVVLGTAINMLLVIITAYPLSKEVKQLRARTAYVWFFAITMFFSGGLIPTYIIVKKTMLMDSILALILPGALNVWNMLMLLNFFRGIPKELEEAAIMDGAGTMTILWRTYLPLSKPALATILLFTVAYHWNSWFDGIIYMNSPEKYPLQSYLSTLVKQQFSKQFLTADDINKLRNISERTLQAAQIFLGALPIIIVYSFFQKYFIKGIVMGSVKG